ncbi:MAG TPA: S53 family peptidase [Pirellulales bacterium]|nr:S53 family peptidase [Pirellulales bacterium]
MLTASPLGANVLCQPTLSFFAGSGFNVYSPAQIRHAYGFDQVSWNGAGQTIAIVDAYNDPTVAADLHRFDQQFGLPDPKLTVAQMTSGGRGPAANSGWDMEIALDVEWAHAIAPGASILLVEANSASLYSLLSAVDYARHQAGVSVVSMSWGAGEFNGEGSYDSYFTTPSGHAGVTFVASSGDSGAPASWPSISSNVVAVGGTTLSLGSGGSYGSEKGWSGSGGGYSPYESEPSFQRGFQNTGHRSNPDVAYDADPYSGFYVYDSASGGSWYAVGGTSAGAPQWAGLIADANQGRAAAGRAPLSSALQAIYSLASADFHDITSGNNGYAAGPGYDAVTGRGSPNANLVVRDLIAYGVTTTTVTHSTSTVTSVNPSGGRMTRAAEAVDGGLAGIGEFGSSETVGFGTAGQETAVSSTTSWATGSISTSSTSLAAGSLSNHLTDAAGDQALVADSSGLDLKLAAASSNDDAGAVNKSDVQFSNGDHFNSLPEAIFEQSPQSSFDPLGAIDRVERLINRYLESNAGFNTAGNRGLDNEQIDACLADPQWLNGGDAGTQPANAAKSDAGDHQSVPFAAAAMCLMIESGWGRRAASAETNEKNQRRPSS